MHGLVRLADRSILRVVGPGSSKFLQGLCTQDMNKMPEMRVAPAAFLSAKGRVFCDTIVVATAAEEFLLDCHSAVSAQLLRFLKRHNLREKKRKIEDVSSSLAAVALLPREAHHSSSSASTDSEPVVPSDFFPDPRFAALGHRSLLETQAADKLVGESGLELSAYHLWRVCCAVPEGPVDLPPDNALPLFCNLDLLNFISFKKGCYIGQELTMRTKHVGKVGRRMFSVVSAKEKPQEFIDSLDLDPTAPLPVDAVLSAEGSQLPAFYTAAEAAENEDARAVKALKQNATSWKAAGVLHSAAHNVGLCLLRGDRAMNHTKDLTEMPLAAGTELALGGVPLGLRPPPYFFTQLPA